MTTILIIEDDHLIVEPVEQALKDTGYAVLTAPNGKIGLQTALDKVPDLVLLDVMLPEMNGWDVCKTLRHRSTVPILMVTALSDEVDRILGLELGADDYLTKPFSTRELIAHVKATLRRVELDQPNHDTITELELGDIRLDLVSRRAFNGKRELYLRFKEFELLSLFMSRAGEAITRADLFDEIWGTDWLGDTRTLDVHIRWLREKLEADPGKPRYLQTVRGVGYRFALPD